MQKKLLPEPDVPLPPPLVRAPLRHRHAGGAWKVAYADFVTALMALFIVLWMMNSSARVKQSVQGYFRDPLGYTRRMGAGAANSGEGLTVSQQNVRSVQSQLEAALKQMPDFHRIRNNIMFSVTGEGLRIDLLENDQGMFFVSGDPDPTEAGERLLKVLGDELSKMPNELVIEGHTDASPFRNSIPTSRYTNWELASDRANTARRVLYTAGLNPERVVEVRGFADHRLLNPANPNDPKNRRISVVVKFGNQGK